MLLDSEFLAISLVFIAIGAAGIILFYGPPNATGDSCYCLIPSPEPGAAQGTSSIILALGILFFPMGLMKGGLPTFRRQPGPMKPEFAKGTVAVPAPIISNALLFAIGIALLVVGIDAVVVPGYLILRSTPVVGAGATLSLLGAYAMYLGSRKPKDA
jgi:hypothetical protein